MTEGASRGTLSVVAPRRQDPVQSFLVSDRADIQTRLSLLSEAFGAMSRAMTDMIAHLTESGRLDPDAEFIERWQKAAEYYQQQGLRAKALPGEAPEPKTECPSCKAVLRNVSSGGRCDWCGHVFPLLCPSCMKSLDDVKGDPGDVCLWCNYQF